MGEIEEGESFLGDTMMYSKIRTVYLKKWEGMGFVSAGLLNKLIALLEGTGKLVVDGKLNKNSVVERALRCDESLLSLLMADEAVKKHFFTKVGDVFIFDKIKFQQFVSNKQFLPDSYTAFKNKIGLTARGEYLTQSKEVVLSWPYKDCLLQGGQTKDDHKRKEVFLHQTLAPDEITTLLSPKVMKNFKRFDGQGEHAVSNISREDNLMIKGNNLLVLHSLKKRYAGQIKLIYIDPPYNTESDSFRYNDSFTDSAWLTFMKNRLEVARELLSEDGVLFIQCDDNEQAYLKVLMEQVFGRKNFLANFIWIRKKKGAFLSSTIRKMTEYIVCFSKTIQENRVFFGEKAYPDKQQPLVKRTNKEKTLFFTAGTIQSSLKDGNYNGGKKGKDTGVNLLNDFKVCQGKIVCDLRVKGKFVWTQEFLDKEIVKGTKIFLSNQFGFNVLRSDQADKMKAPSTLLEKKWVGTNEDATKELADLFVANVGEIFSHPKPASLIKYLVNMVTFAKKDAIILDFFAGSGTTAQAVLDLNKEDGGNRKFILCEQMDYIHTVTKERVKKVIERNKKGAFVYCELAADNAQVMARINKASSGQALRSIWRDIQKKDYLSYRVDPHQMNANIKEFEQLTLAEQKQFLIDVLDKNYLYVNYTSIEDDSHQIATEDKKCNKQFYGD